MHEGDVGQLRVRTPEGLRTITYLVQDGHAIHEGDVDLGTIEQVERQQHDRGGAANLGARWPGGRVYYRFAPAFTGQVCNFGKVNCVDVRTQTRNILATMAAKLPITFVEDIGNVFPNHITFGWADPTSNFGGSSNAIGMLGGEQTIVYPSGHLADTSLPETNIYNLQPNFGTLEHEMLHALGLWHEQSRPDRNLFVSVNAGCILNGKASQFALQNGATPVGPYDYLSLMHYSTNAFCNTLSDGVTCTCPTLSSIVPGGVISPGSTPGRFSPEDTNTMFRMYTRSQLVDAAADHFGQAVAIGDFDADGYDDLAVGIPDEDIQTSSNPVAFAMGTGRVALYKGTSVGLVAWTTLSEASFAGASTTNGRFGASLVATDLDADGITDLAVGAPGANGNSGAVFTFLGNVTGIPSADRELTQQIAGYTNESGDRFGETLAAGPVTGQTRQDSCIVNSTPPNGKLYNALVIGAPGDRNAVPFSANTVRSGAVYMFQYVINCGNLLANATRVSVPRGATGDDFGGALAVGDLDSDGKADVAIGAPHRNANDGAVYTYRGLSPSPLASPLLWSAMVTYETTLSGSTSEQYGSALAIGDIMSAYSGNELVIGAPGNFGSVKVLAGGLSPLLMQTLANFPVTSGDRYGAALAIGNVDATTSAVDLVVGIPGQNSGAGAISIVRGGTLSPRTNIRQSDMSPIFDNAPGDGFGTSLAIGQLDGRGQVPSTASTSPKLLDLAIGGPGEAPELAPFGQGPAGSGAVALLKGTSGAVVAPWVQFGQPFDGHL